MNVNERAEELYKKGKVSELMEYLNELFGEESITYVQYGYLYDIEKYTADDIKTITDMGIPTNGKDCFEGFNLINISTLIKRDDLTLKTARNTYSIFQTDTGGWVMTDPEESQKENGLKFKHMTFDSIISFFTDLGMKKEDDFTYIQQVSNAELIEVYGDFMEALKLTIELFNPSTNQLSKTHPSYIRYKFFLKPLKPIFNELGYNIKLDDKGTFWEDDENIKKVLSISKSLGCYKFHIIEFDFMGIRYEVSKDFGTMNGFILSYNNVVEELESDELTFRIQEIYDNGLGVEYYNAIFDVVNEEHPEFVSTYMNSFTKFSELMEDVIINSGGSKIFDDTEDTMDFSKCRMTMLSTVVPHIELELMIDAIPSDVIRLCYAEYRKYKAWFSPDRTISLQDTETFEILTFDKLTKFDKHLEKIYNKKLKAFQI